MAEESGFSESAKSLAHNPLGVIALFITLVQSFATLLLGVGVDKWQSGDKLPLIWFVVIFPFVVLGVFFILVTRYHDYLYAPSDYRTDKGFPQKLTRLESAFVVKTKIDSADFVAPSNLENGVAQPKQTLLSVETKTAQEDQQIRSAYLGAESLALKRLEKFYDSKIQRDVSFGNGIATAFDGVMSDKDVYVAVEVKLLARPIIESSFLNEVVHRGSLASELITKKSVRKVFRLVLAFVLISKENEGIENFMRDVRLVTENAPFPIDFHIFALSDLKKEFGSDSR